MFQAHNEWVKPSEDMPEWFRLCWLLSIEDGLPWLAKGAWNPGGFDGGEVARGWYLVGHARPTTERVDYWQYAALTEPPGWEEMR